MTRKGFREQGSSTTPANARDRALVCMSSGLIDYTPHFEKFLVLYVRHNFLSITKNNFKPNDSSKIKDGDQVVSQELPMMSRETKTRLHKNM